MAQGILPFHYQEEKIAVGTTALAGLPLYLELIETAGLRQSIQGHVQVQGSQGWTDAQVLIALLLLNLAGGESVDDLQILEKDAGLCAVLQRLEGRGLFRKDWRELARRWRKARQRTVPSASAVFRYLGAFHSPEAEERRLAHTAFIPTPNDALRGLGKVNADLVAFVQNRGPQRTATLDMDATLAATEKAAALYSYQGCKAYQPLQTYWAEQGLLVHSEFRDGPPEADAGGV